jgi:hypothetical protein
MTGAIITAAVADTFLTLKVVEFLPDNIWLWRNGPTIARHMRHDPQASLPEIEAAGLPSCEPCQAMIPPRPRLSLKFIELPAEARFTILGRTMRLQRWLDLASKLSYLAFWTPLLAVTAGVLLTVSQRTAPPWLLAIGTADFGLIASFSLLVAPLLRLSLGPFDVQYSDLARLVTLVKRRLPQTNNEREALAIYFLGLLVVSIICYAMMFQGIFAIDPRSFHFSWGDPSPFSWIYYSVSTASTFGDDQASVTSTIGQIGVTAQILTGPLLIFWLLSIMVDRE